MGAAGTKMGEILKLASKPHLTANGCVVPRIEMLTYERVRSAFNPLDALPLTVIWGFEANFTIILSFILFSVAELFDGFEKFGGDAKDALVAIFQFNGALQ